ncbi:MAG: hypothetical protein LAN37_08760 [Acidobacteriia bacterium]|nr:hypothetical protein [Terriglobia bacterium]
MPRPSPVREGFRTAIRYPGLAAAEIAWRWSFGAAAWGLLIFACFAYLHSLTVTDADWLLIRTKVPTLVAEALRHIFSGSWPRLFRAAAVLLPAISVLWIFAASLARWASLRALLAETRGRFRTLLGLHFLRAATALAAWVGYLGALLVAGFAASRGVNDRPGLFLLVFFLIAAIIGFFHGRLRWYLFLAGIFAVRDGSDSFASIAAAFDAYRDRRRAFLSLAAIMWVVRSLVLVAATVVSLVPLGVLRRSSWIPVAVVLALITLVYFVVADFLFVARLAAYVEILRDEPVAVPPVESPVQPPPDSATYSQSSDAAGAPGTSALGAADV